MTIRPSILSFTEAPAFFPPGLPLEPWEVYTDSAYTYEVEANGRLIRKDKHSTTRWLSLHFTGSFSVTIVPRYSQSVHMYHLYVVCGLVTHMQMVDLAEPVPLEAATWPWVLDALTIDRQAVEEATTYKGCIRILQKAELDLGYRSNDQKVDAMIGMALCRPALLKGNTARNALECLDDHQLRAAVSWHRAHLSD